MLGVVELQDQTESKEALSPELRAAAMKAVARQAEGRNLKAALPSPRHLRWGLMVALTAAIIGAALWKVPKPSQNAFERWLKPFSDVQRYTFTKISDFEETMIVPMDEPFSVTLTLSELSDQTPTSGVARFGIQEPVSAQLQDDKKSYTFDFPGQSEPGLTTMGTTTWISDTFFELATQNAPTFLGEASEGEAVVPAQGGHRRQCVDGVREALQLKKIEC